MKQVDYKNISDIKKLYQQGLSSRKIAEKLDLPISRVQYIIFRREKIVGPNSRKKTKKERRNAFQHIDMLTNKIATLEQKMDAINGEINRMQGHAELAEIGIQSLGNKLESIAKWLNLSRFKRFFCYPKVKSTQQG